MTGPTRLAAAAVLAAAASVGVGVASGGPASAAPCPGAAGVSVVVDHAALGGGVEEVCSPSGGGRSAAALFEGAGFHLDYVQRQPGFVCRVNGQPASDPCVNTPPADAYWGLWWSDGRSGSWSYSSVGAGSLTVPEGGYVAFAWQSGGRSAPSTPATAHAPPTPTAKPSAHPSKSPTAKPSPKPSRPPSPTPSPTRSPAVSSAVSSAPPSPPTTAAPATGTPPDQTSTPTPAGGAGSASAPPSPTSAPSTTTADAPSAPSDGASLTPGEGAVPAMTTDSGALPVWVVPLVIAALGAAAGATYLLRRRQRPGP